MTRCRDFGLRLALPALLAGVTAPTLAQIPMQAVVFPQGKTQASMLGSIKGDGARDYMVRLGQGQSLTVSLVPSNRSTYFNVLRPDSDEAIFNGSIDGNSFSGAVPEAGAYRIRVYMMGAAADTGKSSIFTLKVGVGGMPGGGGYRGGSTGGGGGGGKATITDLVGRNDIRAIDMMAEKGFRDVDSFESGAARYGIFWRPQSRQCVQLTFANGRVEGANDIGTHPKCR